MLLEGGHGWTSPSNHARPMEDPPRLRRAASPPTSTTSPWRSPGTWTWRRSAASPTTLPPASARPTTLRSSLTRVAVPGAPDLHIHRCVLSARSSFPHSVFARRRQLVVLHARRPAGAPRRGGGGRVRVTAATARLPLQLSPVSPRPGSQAQQPLQGSFFLMFIVPCRDAHLLTRFVCPNSKFEYAFHCCARSTKMGFDRLLFCYSLIQCFYKMAVSIDFTLYIFQPKCYRIH